MLPGRGLEPERPAMEDLMERERINPPELFKHPAFTRIVTVKGPCKFIFIAGLTAADNNYKCVAPGDCRAQYINILENLTRT